MICFDTGTGNSEMEPPIAETAILAGCFFQRIPKDGVPFLQRSYRFFDTTSFRPSISSACFETILCRRAFSASSC